MTEHTTTYQHKSVLDSTQDNTQHTLDIIRKIAEENTLLYQKIARTDDNLKTSSDAIEKMAEQRTNLQGIVYRIMNVLDYDMPKSSSNKKNNNYQSIRKYNVNKSDKKKPEKRKYKSSYHFFRMEKRYELERKYKDLDSNDIDYMLGRMWIDLSDEDKKKYDTLAYAYFNEIPRISGYYFFCMEKRTELEKNKDLDFAGINYKLSQMWNDLSDKDKNPYEVLASDEINRNIKLFKTQNIVSNIYKESKTT